MLLASIGNTIDLPNRMEHKMLSNEWEDEHLTKTGWVSGSYRHDHGHSETKDVPEGTVLTVRRHVTVGAIGAKPNIDVSETAHIDDHALIRALRAKFGEPTFGC